MFRNGVPFEIVTYNYPVEPFDKRHYLGMYLKDSWTIGRRLTLNLGVRYAHDAGFIPDQCRDAADPPGDVAAPAACYDRQNFNVWQPIIPRMRAVWDVFGNGKMSIKGGWGRYPHMRMMDELQQANRLAANQTRYAWRDLNNNKLLRRRRSQPEHKWAGFRIDEPSGRRCASQRRREPG